MANNENGRGQLVGKYATLFGINLFLEKVERRGCRNRHDPQNCLYRITDGQKHICLLNPIPNPVEVENFVVTEDGYATGDRRSETLCGEMKNQKIKDDSDPLLRRLEKVFILLFSTPNRYPLFNFKHFQKYFI